MVDDADAMNPDEVTQGTSGEDSSDSKSSGGGDGSGPGTPGKSGGDVPPWKNPAYRFVFFFLLYLGIVAVGYPPLRERHVHVIDGLAELTATIQYYFFVPFTDDVTLTEKVVVFKGFAVKIIEECTGVYEVLIFIAAVLAFPTSLVKKAIGFGMGIPLLYVFNVVRIAVLILVGKYLPDYFDFMHLYFWQATLILMITSVWLLWITKVVKSGQSTSPIRA
jgi:exosortase H (IPTLxxWG-CTERM-specific)